MKIKIILLLSGLVAANVCFGQIADPAHTTILSKELSEDCMVCHVCEKGEVPSKVNPRLKQCNRPFSPKNPSTQDIVIIDRLVEKYDAVVFAHSLHANMSSMSGGCTNCHHFTQNVNDIQSCGTSGCHSDAIGQLSSLSALSTSYNKSSEISQYKTTQDIVKNANSGKCKLW